MTDRTGAVLRRETEVGEVSIAPLVVDRDAATVHRWLSEPHAAYWQMTDLDADAVRRYLGTVVADPDQDAWLGSVDGTPTFLVETYDPARVLLADVHEAAPGDLGMHLLVSPPGDRPRHGLTGAVMASVMRLCFDVLGAARVVVEPDVGNTAIARKNAEVGFRVLRDVALPGKTARLSVCTPTDFATSPLGGAR